MNTITRRLKSRLKRTPPVARYLARRNLRNRFPVEHALIAGRHVNQSQQPSILHFSVNKAATQTTKSILLRCASQHGLVGVRLHDYAFSSDLPYLDLLTSAEMSKYQYLFKPTGYLYTVFGGMIEGISEFQRYRVVLMVRDPRDVLVSEYFSVAYSHVMPPQQSSKYQEAVDLREAARMMSLDDYVLTKSIDLVGILERYKDLLLDRYSNVRLNRFEEMVGNFDAWLDELLAHCNLPISDDLRHELREDNARKRPTSEDIYSHIRKGQPGDFREKLKPETIDELNRRFASILPAFGYSAR